MKNIVRDKLEFYESSVDTDKLWEGIQQDKKRKRRAFIWWTGILLLLLLIFLLREPYQKQTDITLIKEKIDHPEIALHNNVEKDENNTLERREKELVTERISNNDLSIQGEGIKKMEKNDKTLRARPSTSLKEEEFIDEGKSNIGWKINVQNVTPEEVNNLEGIRSIYTPLILGVDVPNLLFSRKKFNMDISALLVNNEMDSKQEKEGIKGWEAFIFSGVYHVMRDMTSTNNLDYAELKNTSETPLESIEYGLGAKFLFPNKLYLRTGVQWTRINEVFIYYGTSVKTNYTKENVSFAVSTISKKTHNYHLLTEIPIGIGYEFGGKRWRYSTELSSLLNMTLRSDGEMLNEYGQLMKTGDEDFYKKSIDIGMEIGVGLSYVVSPNFNIGVSGHYKKYSDSFTIDNAAIRQNYSLLGVRLSGLYKL